MRTPLQAMLWELWRTSRFELLFRIVGQSALVLLIYSVTDDISEPEIQVIRGIVIMLLAVSGVFSLTWMNELESEGRQSGFSFRLGFTRPVSTTGLVAVPMLFTVVAAVVCFLLPALLFSLLLGVPMPLFGPVAIIATLVACFVATTWSPTTTVGKSIAVSALLIGAAVTLFAFNRWRDDPDPILMALGKLEYFDVTWYYYVACLAVSVLAFSVTVFAVERQRRGDRSEFGGLWAAGAAGLRNRSGTLSRPVTKPFTSPFAAQFWYEMRRFGSRMLLIGVSFPLIVFVLISAMLWFNADWKAAPIVSLFALGGCPFVYQLFGADGAVGLRRKQGVASFSAFDATRAMPNDQLIAVKLLVIAVCSLIGWLCMGLAVGLHAVAFGDGQAWARIGETIFDAAGDVSGYWWATAIANATLLYMSTSSIFLAFRLWLALYQNRFALAMLALYLHLFLASWDAANGWPLRHYWLACGYLMSFAIIGGCAFALRRALSAGYLGKRLFGCAFCLWVTYVLSTVALYLKLAPGIPIPLMVIALGVSMLLVPLASTAIAPLALASHRHA